MSKTIEQIREELDAKIPREAISERSAGFGKTLSYLSGHYVIDRLNKVLGQGNWDYQTDEMTKSFEGKVNDKFYVSYISKVTLRVKLPSTGESYATYFTDMGFGDGQDSNNPGKCHELAVKEAVTDGIKRCAKSLGMSMGLALYSKDQENVEETAKPEAKTITPPKVTIPAPAVGHEPKAVKKPEDLKRLVKEAARVAFTKNITTVDKFREMLSTEYSAAKVDDLNEIQTDKLYQYMRSTYKELELQ